MSSQLVAEAWGNVRAGHAAPLQPGEIGAEFPVGGGGLEGEEFLGFEGMEEGEEFRREEAGEDFGIVEASEGVVEGWRDLSAFGRFLVGVVGDGRRGLEVVLDAVEPGGEGDGGDEVGVGFAGGEAILESLSLRVF